MYKMKKLSLSIVCLIVILIDLFLAWHSPIVQIITDFKTAFIREICGVFVCQY
jgi:hypothetical protein